MLALLIRILLALHSVEGRLLVPKT